MDEGPIQVRLDHLSNTAAMTTKRGRVLLGVVALVAALAAVPAHADVTGPGTATGTVADCPSGVAPIAVAGALGPPVALPLLAYGAQLGTTTQSCAASHTNLFIIAELYLLPLDGSDTSGVMVDRTFAQCRPPNSCNNAVALGSFTAAPVVGLYRVVGRFSVSTATGDATGILVGPPFIYTGTSVIAPPSLP